MIVKNSGDGKSFGARADYLAHGKDARTDERVEWTKTFNLANEDVQAAINEMQLTADNAELLKQEAGIRGGGRRTENISKHYSLNWAISDDPTQEHMVESCYGLLQHMGWHEHQVVIIAHNDKQYKHAHMLINAVHPETGLRLNDDFENERAQAWALQYEREQNRIHCEQRVKNAEERERNMPRNIWIAFNNSEKEFSNAEENLAKNTPEIPDTRENAEWKILKEIQKSERIQFFADGKVEFSHLRSAIYREVREEFRERWADYYQAEKKTVGDDRRFLADVKVQLMADQKAALDARREPACAELRASRDEKYRELLDRQRDTRAEFGGRLETGQDNSDFFHSLAEKRSAANDIRAAFGEAGQEATHNFRQDVQKSPEYAEVEDSGERTFHARKDTLRILEAGPRNAVASVGSFLDSLFFDATTMGSARPEPMSADERADLFREAAENATKQQQHAAREEEDAHWRERQKDLFRE